MGSNTFYGAGLLLGSDAPQARIGCGAGPLCIYAAPRAREDSYGQQYVL